MKIPESFRVDKKPYAVSLVRHIWPKGTMGTVFYDLRHIEIATHSARSRRRFTRAEIADTFWHEVTHAVRRDMGHSLWCSEKFVTGFSRRLTEVLMTARLPQQMAAPARRAPQEKSRTPGISRDGGSKRQVDVRWPKAPREDRGLDGLRLPHLQYAWVPPRLLPSKPEGGFGHPVCPPEHLRLARVRRAEEFWIRLDPHAPQVEPVRIPAGP